jgi:hypothetical protein
MIAILEGTGRTGLCDWAAVQNRRRTTFSSYDESVAYRCEGWPNRVDTSHTTGSALSPQTWTALIVVRCRWNTPALCINDPMFRAAIAPSLSPPSFRGERVKALRTPRMGRGRKVVPAAGFTGLFLLLGWTEKNAPSAQQPPTLTLHMARPRLEYSVSESARNRRSRRRTGGHRRDWWRRARGVRE